MVWPAHSLLGRDYPLRDLHDVLHVGAGSAADVGLDPQRVDSAGGHRRIENAYAHDACAPGRAGRIEAIEGRREVIRIGNPSSLRMSVA
jgi:hypothetical protein